MTLPRVVETKPAEWISAAIGEGAVSNIWSEMSASEQVLDRS